MLIPARSTDRDLVLSLIRQLYDHEEIEFIPERVGAALDRLLIQPDWGTVVLIQPASAPQLNRPLIAGYALLVNLYSLEFGGRVALLDELWISEVWRGQGLGRKAMAAIEQFCRDQGLVALRLEVGKTNLVARSLYQSLGFQDLDRDFWTKRLD